MTVRSPSVGSFHERFVLWENQGEEKVIGLLIYFSFNCVGAMLVMKLYHELKKNLHFVVVLLSHVVHTLIMNHEIVNLIFKAVSGWLLLREFLWNELLSRSCVFNLRGLKIIIVDLCSQYLMCGLVCD